jgi:hypothetical protein
MLIVNDLTGNTIGNKRQFVTLSWFTTPSPVAGCFDGKINCQKNPLTISQKSLKLSSAINSTQPMDGLMRDF